MRTSCPQSGKQEPSLNQSIYEKSIYLGNQTLKVLNQILLKERISYQMIFLMDKPAFVCQLRVERF